MPVFTFNPDATGAGRVFQNSGTWQQNHDNSDGAGTSGVGEIASFTSAGSIIVRHFDPFDISDIPVSDTVVSAFLRLISDGTAKGNADSDSIRIVQSTQASPTALATADYDQLGTTSLGSITIASFDDTDEAENDITINATGIALIQASLGGYVKLGVRTGREADNQAPTGDNNAEWTQGTAVLSVTTRNNGLFLSLI